MVEGLQTFLANKVSLFYKNAVAAACCCFPLCQVVCRKVVELFETEPEKNPSK